MNERRFAQSRLVPALLAACLSWLPALHTAPAIAEDQGTGEILIKNDEKLTPTQRLHKAYSNSKK